MLAQAKAAKAFESGYFPEADNGMVPRPPRHRTGQQGPRAASEFLDGVVQLELEPGRIYASGLGHFDALKERLVC